MKVSSLESQMNCDRLHPISSQNKSTVQNWSERAVEYDKTQLTGPDCGELKCHAYIAEGTLLKHRLKSNHIDRSELHN